MQKRLLTSKEGRWNPNKEGFEIQGKKGFEIHAVLTDDAKSLWYRDHQWRWMVNDEMQPLVASPHKVLTHKAIHYSMKEKVRPIPIPDMTKTWKNGRYVFCFQNCSDILFA